MATKDEPDDMAAPPSRGWHLERDGLGFWVYCRNHHALGLAWNEAVRLGTEDDAPKTWLCPICGEPMSRDPA